MVDVVVETDSFVTVDVTVEVKVEVTAEVEVIVLS
jgi:hypothetical protein